MANSPDLSLPNEAPATLAHWKDTSFEVSSSPIYSLIDIPQDQMTEIATSINNAAQDYLGFGPGELEDLGLVADPAPEWDFSGKSLKDILDYHAALDFGPADGALDPKYCALAFIVVTTSSWQTEGLLLVGFDLRTEGSVIPSSCHALPEKLGAGLISLRQGDENEGFVDTRDFVAIR